MLDFRLDRVCSKISYQYQLLNFLLKYNLSLRHIFAFSNHLRKLDSRENFWLYGIWNFWLYGIWNFTIVKKDNVLHWEDTVYRENFSHVLFSPYDLWTNLKLAN